MATNRGRSGRLLHCTIYPIPSGSAREKTMTNAMAAFGMAVGGTSLICYALMTRLQNRKRNHRSSGDSATDGGNYAGGDSWSVPAWFGGGHSGIDSSGNPVDSGGGDSGGGGD